MVYVCRRVECVQGDTSIYNGCVVAVYEIYADLDSYGTLFQGILGHFRTLFQVCLIFCPFGFRLASACLFLLAISSVSITGSETEIKEKEKRDAKSEIEIGN